MKKVIIILTAAATATVLCSCKSTPTNRTFRGGNFEVAIPMSEA